MPYGSRIEESPAELASHAVASLDDAREQANAGHLDAAAYLAARAGVYATLAAAAATERLADAVPVVVAPRRRR